MHRKQILARLTETRRLPRAALRAAGERRAELIPLFIREIEAWTENPDANVDAERRIFFVFHLLGSWRATEAYRPVARLLASPGEPVEEALGDAVTETARRVMLNLFDGDPEPLEAVVLAPGADEYVRAGMCEVLAALAAEGRVPLERVRRFLTEGFERLEPKRDNYVWAGWQEAIMALGLAELAPLVHQAYDRGGIEPEWIRPSEFDEEVAAAVRELRETGRLRPRVTPFGDTVEELSGWHGFREPRSAVLPSEFGGPEFNPDRRVGRNEPCPCGSGRKFKRCCGA